MNWDNPIERAALIEAVGPAEYNRLQAEAFEQRAVAKVNGYLIIPTQTRFGLIFAVHGTRDGFYEQAAAEAHARSLPANR